MAVRSVAAAVAALVPVLALAEEPVVIREPWARASILVTRPAAAYLTIESATGDVLTGITTPVAAEVMVHAAEEADGVNRMVHVPALDLPAGESVTLAPGGTHVMLVGLDAKLVEGESFPLTLTFERAPAITIDVPILGIAARGPAEETR